MRIRIRPVDVEIPSKPSELFQNDLLDRKEPIEVLTAVISSIEGPCVISVDAEWGAGKTTFLKLWAQYLRNEEYSVVEYNAWETDFASHPFAALFDAMVSDLTSRERITEGVKQIGTALALSLGEHLLGNVGLSPVIRLIGNVGESQQPCPRSLAEYRQLKDLLAEFRRELQAAADKMQTATGNRKPLVIFIDELDRCRPSYAIELLEVAKHLFSVDGIVFVFGLNQAQLKHSVSVIYGTGFDSSDYLRRFFDLDFVLPAPDRKVFVDRQLSDTGLATYFAGGGDQSLIADAWLRSYLASQHISIRSVAQFAHRAGLALAALPSNMWRFQWATVFALIVRTTDPEVYRRILDGTISDDEAYRRLRVHPSIASLPHRWSFEAATIMACHDTSDTKPGDDHVEQPLLQKHRKRLQTVDTSTEYHAADRICRMVDFLDKQVESRLEGFGFRHAIRRIELMSARHSGLLLQQLAESRNP